MLAELLQVVRNQINTKEMSDISKCKGDDCELKNTCYRFIVAPDPYQQSYFIEPPYQKEDGSCDFYWEVGQSTDNQED